MLSRLNHNHGLPHQTALGAWGCDLFQQQFLAGGWGVLLKTYNCGWGVYLDDFGELCAPKSQFVLSSYLQRGPPRYCANPGSIPGSGVDPPND